MDDVARLPLGGRRWQPFGKSIRVVGQDLTGAVMRLQVRRYPNAPGAPLIDLLTVTNGNAEGLRLISVEWIDGVPVSTIGVKINETTMRATPYSGKPGGDSVFAYDLMIDPVGGYKSVWIEGEFWVLAAVTGADGATLGTGVPGYGQHLPRPNLSPGSAVFQIGDSVIEVTVGPGAGPPGEDGADAAPPDRVDIQLVAGQTRVPATGDFSAPTYGFSYGDAAVVELDGEELVPAVDYTAPGGVAPIVLTSPADGGEWFTVHSFKLEGPDASSAVDRFGFAIGKSLRQKLNERIAVSDARQANDSDDNNALLSLLADGYRAIYLPGQGGLGDNGDWLIHALPWTNPEPNAPNFLGTTFDGKIESRGNVESGLHVIGDGMFRSVIDTQGLGHAFMANSRSDDPAQNFRDLLFQDIGMKGAVATKGFNEPNHLMSLHGVTRVRLVRVWGYGSQADTVWNSMGPKDTTVRYNFDVQAHDCLIDGINRQNRNAFSFESTDGWAVIGCHIRNYTRPDMPGCIDVEPITRPQYRGRIGRVIGNLFENYGGAAIALNLNKTDFYEIPTGIVKVTGNTMIDGDLGVDVYGGQARADLLAMVHRHRILVADNQLTRVRNPMRLRGTSGLLYSRNEHEQCDATLIGNFESFPNREVDIVENKYVRCGQQTGSVFLADDETLDCSIVRNDLIDCGRTDGATSVPFLARSGTVQLRLNDNRVVDPNHRITAFAIAGGGVTVDSLSEKVGNQFPHGNPSVPDNFNPPAPLRGVNGAYVSDVVEVIQPGATSIHDFTVPGSKPNMAFDARIDGRTPADGDIYLLEAFGRIVGGARSVMKNVGTTAITLPVGTKIIISERV